MERIPLFDAQHLTSIAQILGHTDKGLKGSELEYVLGNCGIPDVSPDMTKWKRLFNAFVGIQNSKQVGNHVVMFINRAMNPVQYTRDPALFGWRRDQLNVVLAFSGMSVTENGKIRWDSPVKNLDEALARASRLHAALVQRNVHQDVLEFCRAELLQENYFHAVFEATKSIASKIRNLSGLRSDGASLVQEAFSLGVGGPLLAITALETPTDEGEQRGFVNLLIGLFGTIRNPLAHNPKVDWNMTEQDALDVLTLTSLIHRKLDNTRRNRA